MKRKVVAIIVVIWLIASVIVSFLPIITDSGI
jgi:hypothetical protein